MRRKMNKIGRTLIALMLFTSVLSAFSFNVAADPLTIMGMDVSENTEVGGQFNVTVWLYCNNAVDSWYIGLLNWTAGTINGIPDPGWGGYKGNGTIISPNWNDVGASPVYTNGTLNNDSGNITVIQGYTPGAAWSTTNTTACNISFVGLTVGTHDIIIQEDAVDSPGAFSGGPNVLETWSNCSVTIYPQNPSTLTATTYNHTAINLSFTPGEGGPNVTLCGKANSYPNSPSDNVIYNGSNVTYDWASLASCTTFYFSAWTWNETEQMHSLTNVTDTAMTTCYTNFTFAGENPTNSSTTANCTYDITVNVTVSNSLGPPFNYWINGSNGDTESGISMVNQSISLLMSNLNHNTTYSWEITAEKDGDAYNTVYYFTTGLGGGTAPTGNDPGPSTGVTNISVTSATFNVTVQDVDGDPVKSTFFWSNDTVIGTTNMIYPNNSTSVTYAGTLDYNTLYQWYMLLNDTSGCGDSTRLPGSGYYSFTTKTVVIDVTKEYQIHTNNTMEVWINVTNTGEANLTGVVINDTYDANTVFLGGYPAHDAGDEGQWTIPFLNSTGYENNTYDITLWLSLAGQLANGTEIQNTVNATFDGTEYCVTNFADPPMMCFFANKEGNETALKWNMTSFNFTIDITNCGDFYLNLVQVNETYASNFSYYSSSVSPNETNQTFNITQIAPGASSSMWIIVNISGVLENSTRVWNNITIDSNETSPVIYRNVSWVVGVKTESVRVCYISALTNVGTIGDQVLSILGILLIISAILLIVYVVKQSTGLGGGE